MTERNGPRKSTKTDVFDHDIIRDLASLLEETHLAEIEIEHEGLRVRVARHLPPLLSAGTPAFTPGGKQPSPEGEKEPDFSQHAGTITSPMVGTAYLSPKPGDPPFVSEGDSVIEGQTLMIIEAMKTMNPIPAVKSGTVLKILVPNARPVEYGEPLLIIE